MILKFRADDGSGQFIYSETNGLVSFFKLVEEHELGVYQFTGLQDKNGIDYYLGDIGEFSNGDKFYLAMEGWLEVYIEWIGQPECEDQGRDLYRIGNAKIIGNIHQHSHLLDKGE